jgi:3-hydroxyacyl-CoA dehydrogenase
LAQSYIDERVAGASAKLLKERYLDQGKLGTSTGEGFYSYQKK